MKNVVKKYIFDFIVIALFAIAIVIAYLVNYQPIIKITENNFAKFITEMLSFLPLLFIIIGLFDVWIPKEIVAKHIGEYSGVKGVVIVIFLAMLQAGPLYASFPVAYMLWKKGSSIRNVFIYIGAFSSFKIPMLTFEIGFLGLKFSILRALFTIPTFIVIGILMEKYVKDKNFQINKI